MTGTKDTKGRSCKRKSSKTDKYNRSYAEELEAGGYEIGALGLENYCSDEVYASLIYLEHMPGVDLVWRVREMINFIHVVNIAERELGLMAYRVARQLLVLIHTAAKKTCEASTQDRGFPAHYNKPTLYTG
jgi:hypothetical protein